VQQERPGRVTPSVTCRTAPKGAAHRRKARPAARPSSSYWPGVLAFKPARPGTGEVRVLEFSLVGRARVPDTSRHAPIPPATVDFAVRIGHELPAPPMPRAWQRPGPRASPAGQPLLFRDVHGGVHQPCFRGVGSACSSASLRRQNTCTHLQTPHRYGVCSTSRMYSLKAHTGFERHCKPWIFWARGVRRGVHRTIIAGGRTGLWAMADV